MKQNSFFKIAGSLFLVTSLLSGCGPKGNEPNIEIIQDMMVGPQVKAQRSEDFFADGLGMRMPPPNTRPVGFKPYKFAMNIDAVDKELKNPFAGEKSQVVLSTGQKYFETYCMVCHGAGGKGDGPISKKYPLPIPALISDKVKGWSDGRIYHTVTVGQGTMGSYAAQVPQKYRWQLVQYVRHLQK